MNLTSLSKSVHTLTLMTLLSVMVGASVQPSAQAQARNSANPESEIACVPPTIEEGFIFLFKDITLSQRQGAAIKKLSDEAGKKVAQLSKQLRTEVIADSPVSWTVKGASIPDALAQEINAALDALVRDNVPPVQQIKLLTQKYGRSAEFSQATRTIYTPAQLALQNKIQRELEAQIATVLTPDQQKIYRVNLLRDRQIAACSPALTTETATRRANQTSQAPTRQTNTIVDIAASNTSFTTLVQAVKAAGLTETLSGKGPFTVFAPTNEAFAALPKGTLEKLLRPENRKTLQKILTYHVVSGNVLSKDLRSGNISTVEGSRVAVRVRHGKNGGIRVNSSTVVGTDIRGTNGVVHVIDRVLLPPNLKL